jgi:hypothetical protein
MNHAYLQYSDNLMRQVFLRPSKEFELPPGKLLKLQKPLCGLANSWYNTMSQHIKDDIGMQSTTGDMAFFFKHIGDNLVGLTGTYVDDSIWQGILNLRS